MLRKLPLSDSSISKVSEVGWEKVVGRVFVTTDPGAELECGYKLPLAFHHSAPLEFKIPQACGCRTAVFSVLISKGRLVPRTIAPHRSLGGNRCNIF